MSLMCEYMWSDVKNNVSMPARSSSFPTSDICKKTQSDMTVYETEAERNVNSENDMRTNTIEETVSNMQDKIKSLEAKVDKLEHLQDKVASLEKSVGLKDEKIAALERAMEQKAAKEIITEENTVNEAAVIDKGNPVARSLTKYKFRGIRQVETVAFSAVMTDNTQHLGSKQTIKFNRVLLNDGHGYEPNTGVFTAPLAGTYLFTYNFGHHGTGETWLELVKNGVMQNGAAVEGHFGSQNLQGGNAAIIKVNQGDTVWVETWQVSDVTAQGTFTTFSGALLY